ncbi:SHOCT domain-containing protein [Viridibacillus sp. FSL R5-0477]|uniref:SHOCT domain-containing protein n=1 Tax=Viridibacillus arenosi FSL R5-213 TaxID=1227360 RepID=W4EQG9_9BACL|nr:SHOCT domain-containing protein [Viridibacillus arenosi]ETT82252.1 hypothetical protein C176_14717 [Viridibacillus arenosi FSL R5-213]OMC92643.1 hypothetical protein BK137_06280 [Viridibacillus arenosi]
MGCAIGCISIIVLFIILWLFTISPVLGILSVVGWFGMLIWGIRKTDTIAQKGLDENNIKLGEKQKELSKIIESQSYTSKDNDVKLILDEDNKKIGIINLLNDNAFEYDYKDILEVTILENGDTVTKTSRSSQVGGALLGAVVAGGVGAIIGGLTGERSSTQHIENIELKIIVNDYKYPVHIIPFFDTKFKKVDALYIPMEKNDSVYKLLMEKVNHWHGILGFAIKEADDLDSGKNNIVHNNLNISSELKNLHDLKIQGILTAEEFEQQKNKILNS